MPLADGMVLEFAESGPRLHFRTVGANCDDTDLVVDATAAQWVEDIAGGNMDAATDMWTEFFPRAISLSLNETSRMKKTLLSAFLTVCMPEWRRAGFLT